MLGGESKGFFRPFGQYDLVAFSEMPDSEATATVQLIATLEGDVETEKLRAFTTDEVRDALDDVPG